MKNIFYKSILFCLAVSAVSCQKEEAAVSLSLSSTDANVTVSADAMTADVTILPEGSTAMVTVNTPGDWKLIDDADEPAFDVEIDGNDIAISAKEIVSSHERKALLRVHAGNAWAYINVAQRGTDYAMLSISNNRVVFEETGGVQTLSVETNKDWHVEPLDNAKWVTIEEDRENGLIRINADINLVPEDIEAAFRVVAGTEANNYSVDFKVYQGKWTEPSFSFPILKQITLPADREVGGRTSFEVKSNRRWHAESSDSWLKLEQKDGALIVSNEASEELLTGTVRVYTEPQEGEEPYEVEFTVRTDDKPMILRYTVPEGAGDVKIAAPAMAPFDIYIDWGDGSEGNISSSAGGGAFMIHDHIYSIPGEYDVKVYGDCGSIAGMGVPGMAYLTELVDWGDMGITSLNNAFKSSAISTLPDNTCDILAGVKTMNNAFVDCARLNTLPPHMFSKYTGTQLQGVFNGCRALTEIPADLFEGAESVTTLTAVFTFTGITEIPEGLLDPLVNLQRTTTLFRGSPVEKVPENLFAKNPKLLQVRNAFQETAITSIPENIFANNPKLQDIGAAFYDTDVTEIPENLLANNPDVYSVNSAFAFTPVTEVPAGLFANCENLSDVSQTFMGCANLTRVPVNVFDNNKNLTQVGFLFALCENLEGETPYTVVNVDGADVKVHLYERNDRDGNYVRLYPMFSEISRWGFEYCFGGCTKIDDYEAASAKDFGKWTNKPVL